MTETQEDCSMRGKLTPNESEIFSAAMSADDHGLSAAARFMRKEMRQAWEAIDIGRQKLETRMAEVGILEPPTLKAGVLRLNIGGARVHVAHSILRGKGEKESSSSRLSDLLENVWDDRLPRDSEGYIVVDESPSCAKYLIHQLLKRSGTAMGMGGLSFDQVLASDEKAYMPHVCRVLGLDEETNRVLGLDEETNMYAAGISEAFTRRPGSFFALSFAGLPDAKEYDNAKSTSSAEAISAKDPSNHSGKIGVEVKGGSRVLDPVNVWIYERIKQLCPGKPAKMELLYRASRDGWTGQDFHSRCGDDSPSTITLFLLPDSSVVGGFSSVSWSCKDTNGMCKASPGACVFMVKDRGNCVVLDSPFISDPKRKFLPGKSYKDAAVFLHPNLGPTFGCTDTGMMLGRLRTGGTDGILRVDTTIYGISRSSPLSRMVGESLADVEVFRVCAAGEAVVLSPPPGTNLERNSTIWEANLLDLSVPDPAAMSAESYNDDVRSFGVSIADCLMEERVALHQARVELQETRAKAAASVDALSALYGEDVAANGEGVAAVVELNVRGTRMTTLRSTLQACSDSAFAARFDEDKWPPSEKDVDEHGRRVINDCSPSVFSKVLDVLRMRKREAWAAEGESNRSDVRVVVKAADRESFEAFVHMYFTDQESFIMDLVQKPDEACKNDNPAFGGRRASEDLADDDGALSRRYAVGVRGSNSLARRSSGW